MSNRPLTIESFASVSLSGAEQVAEFVERMIDTHAPQQSREEWRRVADALYALTNDTDAIVVDGTFS